MDQLYTPLPDGDGVGSVDQLRDSINDHFISLTLGFAPPCPSELANIAINPYEIPAELYRSEREAYITLHKIKIRKAPGPDNIPDVILKEFAFELAPAVTIIYNASPRDGFVLPLLKSAAVFPLPKSIENGIRSIPSTCQVAKIMEGFT